VTAVAFIYLALWAVMNAIATIAFIGRPRQAITPGAAVAAVIIHVSQLWAAWYLWTAIR